MDNIAMNTHEHAGPFEQWINPVTGDESAFVTFPVANGRMPRTVNLIDQDEYGRRRQWEITYTPQVENMPPMLHVWGDAPLSATIKNEKPDTAVETVQLVVEEWGDGRWVGI